jgi:hypothetical protein
LNWPVNIDLDSSGSLSAHLAEQTKNQTYLNATISAAKFASTQMFDTKSQIMISDFTVGNSTNQCVVDATVQKRPYQHGGFIEALAVLSDITNDPQWSNL